MAESDIGAATLDRMSANWIDRGLLPALRRSATDGLPVTVLVGPRSCGKTTLAARLVKEGVYRRYVSFADPGVRSAAAASPQLFVDSLPFGTVIDEAQLVPEVLVPVKSAVDAIAGTAFCASMRIIVSASAGTSRSSSVDPAYLYSTLKTDRYRTSRVSITGSNRRFLSTSV